MTLLPSHLARVYAYLLRDLSARQIAQKTTLSHRTVSSYTQEIYQIFNVHSRKELQEKVKVVQ